MSKWTPRLACMAALALVTAKPTNAAPIQQDYIALGDSVAFGETDFTHNPSDGDRGYVSLYANYLQSQGAGHQHVINLAVDGETTTTFFKGGPQGSGPSPGQPAPQLNTNYPDPPGTQNALLLSTIASEHAAGHNIGTVSIQLGANDLYQLALSPGFLSESAGAQASAIAGVLATVQANDTKLLTELHTLVPHANVILMGYYNPFNGVPTNPLASIADPAIKALNAVIAGEAAAFHATYVDTYDAIAGHELQDTYISTGNVHPNAEGYQLIALAMEHATQVASVPEPSSVVLMGAGLAVWLGLARRKKQRSA